MVILHSVYFRSVFLQRGDIIKDKKTKRSDWNQLEKQCDYKEVKDRERLLLYWSA